MVHVLFLITSLATVALEQILLIKLLPNIKGWWFRQGLQIMALAMPMLVMFLFSLTMSPSVFFPEYDHNTDHNSHREWLLGVAGFTLLTVPIGVTFGANLVRLVWLYLRTFRNTWAAPPGMETLASQTMGRRGLKVRLWHSSQPFAYNLPGLPFCKGYVILSTGLVGDLSNTELKAVIWHEQAHLIRRDFWINWFATWSAAAFFYLPGGRALVELIKKDQELACDEKVARFGGINGALALADALLKVWEKLLAISQLSPRTKVRKGFQAPGLTPENAPTLTEQRVTRLIEFSSAGPAELLFGKTPLWSKTFLALISSLVIWSASTWIIHLLCPELG
ncbi:MAG: M56 family metallopeptidase [Chloroflexi bacterium]|nr:M56 family metallopeptidase [Chloroflexota bacterium]OJV93008.1 MAG: hypothetical protein BGO39_21075 [Chloroflexi bacterium 54-19]